MKKGLLIFVTILLTAALCSCAATTQSTEDIHAKIHEKYYNIGTYTTNCSITSYSGNVENTYECDIEYNSAESSFKITNDDMIINLCKDKTIITKGPNKLESIASQEDMYIFINTFFKSYYESEDTIINVVSNNNSDVTLLECSVINPSEIASSMKLWINNDNVLPVKMQVFNQKGNVSTEIIFKNFNFI